MPESDILDPEAMKNMRYVIFSDTRGIYLGGTVWSNDETAPTKAFAPTFAWDTKTDYLATGVSDARLMMVHPDLAGGMASKNACADAGLPRW